MLRIPGKNLGYDEDIFLTLWQAILASIIVLLGLKVATILYTAFYNVFLHPLRRFPGPVTWIAAPWIKSIAHIRGQQDHQIVKLHQKHGHIIRVGPDTLSFTEMSAWRDIYGTGHAELPKHIYKGSGMEERPNIITAHSRDHHRFRKAMTPALTPEAITHEEALIRGYVDMLIQHLHKFAKSSDRYLNVSQWYTMTTFDIFGDLCYGESFNSLATGKQHLWLKSMSSMKVLVPLLVFPYISLLLVWWLLSPEQRRSLSDHQTRSYELTMKRIANRDTHPRHDFMTFMLRNRGEDQGVTDHELASNSDIVISAGSETTSTALTGITFFLCSNPDAMARCSKEVREAFSSDDEITFKATAELPFMLACIEETLRMYPPVPTSLIRRTLPGRPTLIAGELIPENTIVGVHHLAAYRSERNFFDAMAFRPERWLAETRSDPKSPFKNDILGVVRPFSYGPRNCIGRNLAYHEMRLILAKLLWNFDLKLMPGYETWGTKQRTFQLWEKPKLMIEFKERQFEV